MSENDTSMETIAPLEKEDTTKDSVSSKLTNGDNAPISPTVNGKTAENDEQENKNGDTESEDTIEHTVKTKDDKLEDKVKEVQSEDIEKKNGDGESNHSDDKKSDEEDKEMKEESKESDKDDKTTEEAKTNGKDSIEKDGEESSDKTATEETPKEDGVEDSDSPKKKPKKKAPALDDTPTRRSSRARKPVSYVDEVKIVPETVKSGQTKGQEDVVVIDGEKKNVIVIDTNTLMRNQGNLSMMVGQKTQAATPTNTQSPLQQLNQQLISNSITLTQHPSSSVTVTKSSNTSSNTPSVQTPKTLTPQQLLQSAIQNVSNIGSTVNLGGVNQTAAAIANNPAALQNAIAAITGGGNAPPGLKNAYITAVQQVLIQQQSAATNTTPAGQAYLSNLQQYYNTLGALQDEAYVIEAPSFIVPYVMEGKPKESIKDFLKKMNAEVNKEEKKIKEESDKDKKETSKKDDEEKENSKESKSDAEEESKDKKKSDEDDKDKEKESEEKMDVDGDEKDSDKTEETKDKELQKKTDGDELKEGEKVKKQTKDKEEDETKEEEDETKEEKDESKDKEDSETKEKEDDDGVEIKPKTTEDSDDKMETNDDKSEEKEKMEVDEEDKENEKEEGDDKEKKEDEEEEEDKKKEPKYEAKEYSDTEDMTKDDYTHLGRWEGYYKSTLGQFMMDLGLSQAREFIQADLLKMQKRKLDKMKTAPSRQDVNAVKSLDRQLSKSRAKNAHLKLETKVCKFCNYRTDSKLVMDRHLESPHMANFTYKCNYCNFETRGPQVILFHMEAEHMVRGRLERAPAFFQCQLCPFEDNNKSKMTRHSFSCAKKFKPERNCDLSDWEPPAKIPKQMTRGRNIPMAANSNLKNMMANMGNSLYEGAARNLLPKGLPANLNLQQLQAAVAQGLLPSPSSANAANSSNRGRPIGSYKANLVGNNNSTSRSGPFNKAGGSLTQAQQLALAGQLFQNVQGNKGKGGSTPSISITPLPRSGGTSGGKVPTSKDGKPSFVICEICDGYIKDLEQLRNHMNFIHKVKIHPKMIYNRPPLNCQKCQQRFFTDQGLERHLLGTHGLVTSSMQEAANKSKDAGRCPICGKVFQWKLLNHVARDHKMTLKPAHLSYKCTVCTATFNMYRLFENHVYSAHSVVNKNKEATKTNGSSDVPLKINDEITIIPQPSGNKSLQRYSEKKDTASITAGVNKEITITKVGSTSVSRNGSSKSSVEVISLDESPQKRGLKRSNESNGSILAGPSKKARD